jgi:hypothetical protein
MATGMQTGRRTSASAMRTGAGPADAGGPLGGLKNAWGNLDPQKKTLIIFVVAFLVIGVIVSQVVVASNKPVELFPGRISDSDVAAIQQRLLQWNIPCQVAEGGANILVHPKYRSMAFSSFHRKDSQEDLYPVP